MKLAFVHFFVEFLDLPLNLNIHGINIDNIWSILPPRLLISWRPVIDLLFISGLLINDLLSNPWMISILKIPYNIKVKASNNSK